MCGSLTQDEINSILKYFSTYCPNKIKNFVETGTYQGVTSILASKNFDKVYTIEVFEPLYRESKEKADKLGINNISFLLGDSLEKLPEIMSNIGYDSSIYFLDAHISGSDSGWNNKIRVPLLEELDIIMSNRIGPSVFIFDDLRLWKTIKAWDWIHITNKTLLEKIRSKNKVELTFEKDDRFYVFTN